jgi:hypothetical protein
MWSRKDKDGDTILVATHVDDSIVTGSNNDKTDTFVREMLDKSDGTCERNLTEMLGMEWERDIEAGTTIFASEGLHGEAAGRAAESFRFLAIQQAY